MLLLLVFVLDKGVQISLDKIDDICGDYFLLEFNNLCPFVFSLMNIYELLFFRVNIWKLKKVEKFLQFWGAWSEQTKYKLI